MKQRGRRTPKEGSRRNGRTGNGLKGTDSVTGGYSGPLRKDSDDFRLRNSPCREESRNRNKGGESAEEFVITARKGFPQLLGYQLAMTSELSGSPEIPDPSPHPNAGAFPPPPTPQLTHIEGLPDLHGSLASRRLLPSKSERSLQGLVASPPHAPNRFSLLSSGGDVSVSVAIVYSELSFRGGFPFLLVHRPLHFHEALTPPPLTRSPFLPCLL